MKGQLVKTIFTINGSIFALIFGGSLQNVEKPKLRFSLMFPGGYIPLMRKYPK